MSNYRTFPTKTLPLHVGRYVADTADVMHVDAAFVALPALSVLGAAIGTTREVELKSGWCEPPVIWSCIIARSGTLKSPAMEKAVAPLAEAEHKAQLTNQEILAEYEKKYLWYERELFQWKRGKGDNVPPEKPEAPARLRYIVADATLEAIAPLLKHNPRGLLLARDELAAWVRGFNQYKRGQGGDAAAWLELHRAGRLTVDRKTGGTIYVPRAAVSIFGTIQPAVFASAMRGEHFESGLAARLLVAQPSAKPKRFTTKAPSSAVMQGYAACVGELLRLNHEDTPHGPRPFRLSLAPDAREIWRGWYDRHAQRQHEAADDAEAAALAKIEGYAARLALIFALVDDVRAVAVSADAVRRGCVLANWFAREAERVYCRLADNDETRELRALLEWIGRKGGQVTARDLTRGPREYRGDIVGAEKALAHLAEEGLGKLGFDTRPTGGRPTKVFTLKFGDTGDGDETPACDAETGGFGTVAASPSADARDDWPPESDDDPDAAPAAERRGGEPADRGEYL